MLKPKIGVVGVGMVGGAVKKYFEIKGFKRGRDLFCFDADPKKGFEDDVSAADIVFVAVPTPSKKDGSCDTGIIESVIKKYSPSSKVMVIKSTVVPGTTERLAQKYNCALIFSPEFLTEAKSWENMINPDRQIIAPTSKARSVASAVLHLLPPAPFTAPKHKKALRWADIKPTEAELGKYAANTFGALKVTFANVFYDFSRMLEKHAIGNTKGVKIGYNNIRRVLAEDPRIGDSWLNVDHGDYRGYGGYCFPKDTEAIMAFGRDLLKNIPHGKDRTVFKKGLAFLGSMREYNNAVLASQGLTSANISRHDKELLRIIKNFKKNNRKNKK